MYIQICMHKVYGKLLNAVKYIDFVETEIKYMKSYFVQSMNN